MDTLVRAAKNDLARRTGAGIDEISLVSTVPEEWPDASLGCPRPGEMYAQVITPGYGIVLAVRGVEFEYHTDSCIRVVSFAGPRHIRSAG